MAVTSALKGGIFRAASGVLLNRTRAQWYMALASRSWQACLCTTVQLLPDLLVTGATPVKVRNLVAAEHQRLQRAAWHGRSFPLLARM